MDRRTIWVDDPIVGDEPIDRIRIGFVWDIWPTKKGRFVAKTSWEDGNGYQVEAKTRAELDRRIRGHLKEVEAVNREVFGLP